MKRLLALAVPAVLAGSLAAQTFRGGILGTVSDSTGGALPGATVTAVNVATKLTRTAVTDNQGNYFFGELPPGEYSVSASLSGFSSAIVKGVHVEVSASERINLTLSTGGLAENVEVTAELPLVNTTHNTQGGTIQGEQFMLSTQPG